jgi:hypothetical protein
VIDVMGDRLESGFAGEEDQRGRVGASREGAGNGSAGIGETATTEEVGDEGIDGVDQSSASRWRRPRGCLRAVTDFR